jgi:hypothetical protein
MGCSTSKNIASKAPTYDESHGNADAYSSYEEETKGTDNFWTSDKSSCKPIRFSKNGAGSEAINPAKTIPKMLEQAIANSGNKPFLRVESVPTTLEKGATAPASKPVEDWNTRTYSETYEECRNVAKGFMSLGLDALDAVTIYGFNSPEWVVSILLSNAVALFLFVLNFLLSTHTFCDYPPPPPLLFYPFFIPFLSLFYSFLSLTPPLLFIHFPLI